MTVLWQFSLKSPWIIKNTEKGEKGEINSPKKNTLNT